jgi:nucleoside-diphosphate-sugar epimerase
MRVLLTGGTGFIGDAVARALRGAGHDVTIVSLHPGHVPS